ncbi:radical SAM/SPASM domain-containing protein [Hungatella hathewayi]|uniref:radical SAM/SPASM domain-containing protein n=1 Tax=Hungatella hathewayi TaxID=154046 RepID=UPI00356AEEAC
MIDINFYRKFDEVARLVENGGLSGEEDIFNALEAIRSKDPVVYNIETTNRCNMRCQMCPRTTMMKRKIEDIDRETFIKVVDQLKPHSREDWELWKKYVEEKYGITEDDMSENHFFLYIIPRVIQLHGYGDPLLDRHMGEYIRILKERGFYSYFSCNPANIDMVRTREMLDNGLDYIKYSIESVDDQVHKQVRGEASNFSISYQKILEVLDYKKKHNVSTTVVITMLDLNRTNQREDYDRLLKAFEGLDVYIYLKSEDCQWYRKDYHGTKSVHWSEYCKHPWMSMTIKSNAEAAMCMEDYNNEIIFGNASRESLYEIWNGSVYETFRRQHIRVCGNIKCIHECDMRLLGEGRQERI